MKMEPNSFWSRIYIFYWRFEELQAPIPETRSPDFLHEIEIFFFLKSCQLAFFERNQQSFLDLFGCFLIFWTKKRFEHINTQSKFCEMNLGFVDLGLSVRSDEQVENLSCEIQL